MVRLDAVRLNLLDPQPISDLIGHAFSLCLISFRVFSIVEQRPLPHRSNKVFKAQGHDLAMQRNIAVIASLHRACVGRDTNNQPVALFPRMAPVRAVCADCANGRKALPYGMRFSCFTDGDLHRR